MMTSVGRRRPSSPVATAAAAAANHINKHTPERESRALAWRSGRQQWRAAFSDNSRVKLLQDRRQYPNAVRLYKCIYDTPLLSAFRHCQYVQTNFSQYIFGMAGFKGWGGFQASHQTVRILFLANDRCLRDYDSVVARC